MKWGSVKKMISRYEWHLKVMIFLFLLFTLGKLILDRMDELRYIPWDELIQENLIWFLAVGLLAFVNWGLEALKWQLLTNNTSFIQSYKTVLTGLAFKQLLPLGGAGDLSGRVMSERRAGKRIVAGAFLVSSFFQFLASFIFGVFGLFWVYTNTSFVIENIFWAIAGSVLLLIATFFLFRKRVIHLINRWFFTLRHVSNRTIRQLCLISMLRYLTFFSQALILFWTLNPTIAVSLLSAGIAFIYLAKTILPSFGFLGDLGIREISAVFFFSYFDVPLLPIIIASLLIWLVNIFIPSLLVLFFTHKLRLQ